jgi:hypothetical protein
MQSELRSHSKPLYDLSGPPSPATYSLSCALLVHGEQGWLSVGEQDLFTNAVNIGARGAAGQC